MFVWNQIWGKKTSRLPSPPSMEINGEGELVSYRGQDQVVLVPDGVKKIGPRSFFDNKWVKEVIFPQSVVEIDSSAFARSTIERIEIPANIIKMGYCVFQYCYQLKSVILPDTLEYIDVHTFQGCEELKKLELPSNLKKVGDGAFEHCGIVELKIPDSMIYISENSFCRMDYLEKLYLPSTLKGIGHGAFSFCGNLKEISIPEGVTKIGGEAFDACGSLEKVVFPKSLIAMERGAFSGTKLSDSAQLKEIYAMLENMKVYEKPEGYQEMTFGGMKFYYGAESREQGAFGFCGSIDDLSYECDVGDSQKMFKDKNGRKVLRIYVPVPTFDSADREWDSYRKLFLFPEKSKMIGVMVYGGYKIAKILIYDDIRWADEKTEKLLKDMKLFETF